MQKQFDKMYKLISENNDSKLSSFKEKRIEKKMSKLSEQRTDLENVQSELTTLESSMVIYNVGFTNKIRNIDAGGVTRYNSSTNSVDVLVKTTATNPMRSLSHELKHVYQYEKGELSGG